MAVVFMPFRRRLSSIYTLSKRRCPPQISTNAYAEVLEGLAYSFVPRRTMYTHDPDLGKASYVRTCCHQEPWVVGMDLGASTSEGALRSALGVPVVRVISALLLVYPQYNIKCILFAVSAR